MDVDKADLRVALRADRAAEPAAVTERRARVLAGTAARLRRWAQGGVAAFQPTNAEPDIRPLLHALDVPVFLPRVTGTSLEWVRATPGELTAAGRGIPRPTGVAVARGAGVVSDLGVRLILVPALAVDPATGTRLGYGAGFYDRLLDEIRSGGADPMTVAVCRSAELLDLEAEPHDQPVAAVLTEAGLAPVRHLAPISFRPTGPRTLAAMTPRRREVRKAVIPAAGLGTRFLPVTKSVPKELLPLVDRPAIEFVVREAAAAGLTDVLMVSARGKGAIDDYFDRNRDLEQALAAKDDHATLAQLAEIEQLARIHTVRQGQALGLGHAVGTAEAHVAGEPFAVLLGDDLIDRRDPLLPRMIDLQHRLGGSVIALLEVPPERISSYGCVAFRPGPDNDVVEVTDMIEKPPVEDAPSNLAIIGRYVLDPVVFDVLRETTPGRGGEIQLTDALRTMIDIPRDSGGGVHGVVFRGRRYDTGDKQSYLRAVVTLALADPELGRDFGQWLAGYVQDQGLIGLPT